MSKPSLSDALAGTSTEKQTQQEAEATAEATGEAASDTVRANFNIPVPLHRAFKHVCQREGRSMTWVIEKLMREYVREQRRG